MALPVDDYFFMDYTACRCPMQMLFQICSLFNRLLSWSSFLSVVFAINPVFMNLMQQGIFCCSQQTGRG